MIHSTESPELLPYYGSTTQTLTERFRQHKGDFTLWKQGKPNHCSSYRLLERGIDKVAIKLIQEYPCTTKQELQLREAHYIKNNPCINKYVPQGILADSRQDWDKQYYQLNRDKRLEWQKHYHQLNRDKILEWKRQYRQANRDKILEWKGAKITCECGSIVRRDEIARHRRTLKHQAWVDAQSKATTTPKPKIKFKIKIPQ